MERRAPVTCLSFRPDGTSSFILFFPRLQKKQFTYPLPRTGLVFAAGMEDGTIGFASLEDEMPIMIRTLERADVVRSTFPFSPFQVRS